MAIAGLRDLCNPAYVYLVISLATVMIMYIQNFGSSTIYCLGMYECQVGSVGLIFFNEAPWSQLFPGVIVIIFAGMIIIWRDNIKKKSIEGNKQIY